MELDLRTRLGPRDPADPDRSRAFIRRATVTHSDPQTYGRARTLSRWPILDSVNLGRPRPNPYKESKATGIGKEPRDGPVEVRAPGPKRTGLGSGLVGDFIGDSQHHGGDDQAVYAFQREDLDRWERAPGSRAAERVLRREPDHPGHRRQRGPGRRALADRRPTSSSQVTSPRIPCSTFRGWVGEKGWLKMFTADARPGAYLKVITPGRDSGRRPDRGGPPARSRRHGLDGVPGRA